MLRVGKALRIRPEAFSDIDSVRCVHEAAFGRTDEAHLVDVLRRHRRAVLSLVAVEQEKVLGHIMFSQMRAPFRALGLGPISVLPVWQRMGIGKALVLDGIARARMDAWEGIFVVGDPAYYGKFGFDADLASGFSSPYSGPYLMLLALKDLPALSGSIEYDPAFGALD
jgi:putative acetyltransferase